MRRAGPVVIADSGKSCDGTPGTREGSAPSAILGGGEVRGVEIILIKMTTVFELSTDQ